MPTSPMRQDVDFIPIDVEFYLRQIDPQTRIKPSVIFCIKILSHHLTKNNSSFSRKPDRSYLLELATALYCISLNKGKLRKKVNIAESQLGEHHAGMTSNFD